ncbi:UDP-glycosyltransferase 90A1-like [Coffea arabica]|uniref:UDP-glycosyltransferase 90A1-like n=1 Tax=Coffea arabica TaxID=13443 RepID=A0ABM4VYH0_COFAR
MSLFISFLKATKLMKPHFEQTLNTLPNLTFMITDGFLHWTLDSAQKFSIPRLVFYGTGIYATTLVQVVGPTSLLQRGKSDTEEISFPGDDFPWIKFTRNDFDPKIAYPERDTEYFQLVLEHGRATMNSYGLLVNSFYELESIFLDYWNKKCVPRAWSIGPLCLAAQPSKSAGQKPSWIQWLDEKLPQKNPVLYISFGSQAEISKEQLEEVKIALEKSGVNFLWIVRGNDQSDSSDGFENRVKDRGIVVKEWIDQRQILDHKSVQGFLSHCGWNSVIESICAKVPILAWPMLAEQPLNAKMVVEEIKIGIGVKTCDGTLNGLVKWETLKMAVKELMEEESGKEVRKNAKEVGEIAIKAMEEGGSSRSSLSQVMNELSDLQAKRIA